MKENRNSKTKLLNKLEEARILFDQHESSPNNMDDCNKLKKISYYQKIPYKL